MSKSNAILSFLNKWEGRITEDQAFATDCRSLGFEMDSGRSLQEAFPSVNVSSPTGLQTISAKITDSNFLGTAIFSFWRYRTHFCEGPNGGLNKEAQQWLKIAFSRMRELLNNG